MFAKKSLVAAACAWVALNAHALELAPYPQVFSGPQGLEAVLAPAADGKSALMRISGINAPIDKVVFLGVPERRGASTDAYVTTLDGREFGLIQKQGRPYGGGERWVVYLPGQRDAVDLRYDEKKSKQLATADLLAAYERQRRDGVQEKLARFDREKRLAYVQGQLQEKDAAASAACAVPVRTTIDWATIDDAKLQKLSIDSYCGSVASGLESLCKSDAAFKAKAAPLGTIACRFGTELKLRAESGKFVFTTQEDAPNQDDFVRQVLRNQ